MKRYLLPVVLSGLLAGGLVFGGSIKTWTNEALTAADLNSNFSHIHNNMVGGHGARLVNADVSTGAAIAHSKLATPALLPKVMAGTNGICTVNGVCAMAAVSGVTSITRTALGLYTIVFTAARANSVYNTYVTPYGATALFCVARTGLTTGFGISCWDTAGAAADSEFSLLVMDDDS